MKVLLVSNAIYGGAGKACHRLYQALRGTGTDARLLYLDGPPSHEPTAVRLYASARDTFLRQLLYRPLVRAQALRVGDRRLQYKLPFSIHKVEDHPLVEWADVVNLHWVPDFVDYSRFFRKIGSKPVVWTMHGMLPFAGGYEWEMDVSPRNRAVESRIEDLKARAVNGANVTAVAPSAWMLRQSERYPTFRGRRHQRIFNPLPLDVYKPIDRGVAREIFNLPSARKIVMFAADNVASPRKGLKFLLDAIPAIAERDDVMLISVGRGRAPLEPGPNYRHIGMLDDISLAVCYSAADVIVVPSLLDNSPNIIVESLACGTPVVAFDVGGIGELIPDQSLGRLVRDVSAAALADQIRSALASTFDRSRIRRHAEECFAMDVVASQYVDLYSQVMRNE